MMRKLTAVVAGGGSRGRLVYAAFARKFPEMLQVVAVAELNKGRRELFAKENNISADMVFSSAEEMFKKGKIADMAIISSQDRDHYAHAMTALNLGYDLILEKPISPSLKECQEILETATRLKRKVSVSHVLRFAPFYQTAKKLISSGALGTIISIRMAENVGFWHFSHSYVRGMWNNEAKASPSILAKSSHDLDLIVWLTGSKCSYLNSTGGLRWFKKENAPEGATARCIDCPVKGSCPFDAEKIYITDKTTGCRHNGFTSLHFALTPERSEEAIREALKTTPFGRCVYYSDNDVSDDQLVQGRMENGIDFSFGLSAFSAECYRTLHVLGTKGEITGNLEENCIYFQPFGKEKQKIEFDVESAFAGHGGGDDRLIEGVIRYINGEWNDNLTTLDMSMESHFMAFAAEKSRKTGSEPVDMKAFRGDV